MYYNTLLKTWIIDSVDYFLISLFIGSITGSSLKKYLSEEQSMKRLKNSLLKKSSRKVSKSNQPHFRSKKRKKQFDKICDLALQGTGVRGGQEVELLWELERQVAVELIGKPKNHYLAFMVAKNIKKIAEILAKLVKQGELRGPFKFLFMYANVLLQLLLREHGINRRYAFFIDGPTQTVIVITSTIGGISGFTLSWFGVAQTVLTPVLIAGIFTAKGSIQQVLGKFQVLRFLRKFNEIEGDDNLKEKARAFLFDEHIPRNSNQLKMESSKYQKGLFNKTYQDSILMKQRLKDRFGLDENPTFDQIERQIERISLKPRPSVQEIDTITKSSLPKRKGKLVLWSEFIKQFEGENPETIDLENINTEMIKKAIEIKVRNDHPENF